MLVEISVFDLLSFRLELLCGMWILGVPSLTLCFIQTMSSLAWKTGTGFLTPLFVFLLRLYEPFDLSFGTVKCGSQSLSHILNFDKRSVINVFMLTKWYIW